MIERLMRLPWRESVRVERREAVAANTLWDLKNIRPWQLLGCSSLIVQPPLSATGGPLLARNLDFFGRGYLHEYSLLIVHPARGTAGGPSPPGGARAFASIGFPGVLGCFSGINDAGLALSSHEVAQGYQDVVDTSAYVRFPITGGSDDQVARLDRADLLIWTTTPWTLISNVAAAVFLGSTRKMTA